MPSVAAKEADAKIDWNIWRGTKTLWNETRAHSELFTALMGISWFWFVGAVYTTQLPNFVKTSLHGSTGVFNLMLALFSVGIAAGSVLCARLSRGQLRLGLVSLGAAGLAVFGSLLAYVVRGAAFAGSAENLQGAASFLAQGAAYPVIGAMLAIGFFGGFFSVPLYTWLQTASSDEFRAKAIAANNIANALFMVAAALISALLLWAFDSILLLYLLVAAGNIVFLAYLGWRAPQVFGLKKK